MDDERKVRQVETARGHIGRHENARPSVAQGLQRLGAFVLGQLAGKRHGGEAALHETRVRPLHGFARRAEHDRGARAS